jgi:hypothetical protein
MNYLELEKEIENTRTKLNILTTGETILTKENVVEVSQKLDELIKRYYDCHLDNLLN